MPDFITSAMEQACLRNAMISTLHATRSVELDDVHKKQRLVNSGFALSDVDANWHWIALHFAKLRCERAA